MTEDVWIALEEEALDALQSRRRMREKTSPALRKLDGFGEENHGGR